VTVIPEKFNDLLAKKVFAVLATINADGTPQLTPVWFDWDRTHIRVNTAKGRVKDRNLRSRPAVALVIMDPDNPYRYVQIRGRVASVTETVPMHTSTLSPRSTWARTAIPTAHPTRCA